MAREGQMLQDGSCKAAADLSAKQFFGVKLTSAGDTVDLISASADIVYGVLQNKPTSGLVADVCTTGICKAIAGAAITAGVKVMVNTSGKMILFVAGSGNCMAGLAVTGAAGDGSIFTMRVQPIPVLT